MSGSQRIPTDGGPGLSHNPFAALSSEGFPSASENPQSPSVPSPAEKPARKNRGRVDIVRQTAGRGGKTVTVASGFVGIGQPEKEQLAKKKQKTCGAGGTVKDGCIEIQGDKRPRVRGILQEESVRFKG